MVQSLPAPQRAVISFTERAPSSIAARTVVQLTALQRQIHTIVPHRPDGRDDGTRSDDTCSP
jgi:hypothetical protein